MTDATHEIALANGRTIEVTGVVELLPSGALDVRPEAGSAYFLSPGGWWSWSPGEGAITGPRGTRDGDRD